MGRSSNRAGLRRLAALKPLKTNENKGTATLKGTTVELSQDAADLLNETFKTKALEGGFKVGVSTITINTG